jgi:hypothetical protein
VRGPMGRGRRGAGKGAARCPPPPPPHLGADARGVAARERDARLGQRPRGRRRRHGRGDDGRAAPAARARRRGAPRPGCAAPLARSLGLPRRRGRRGAAQPERRHGADTLADHGRGMGFWGLEWRARELAVSVLLGYGEGGRGGAAKNWAKG